MKKTFTLLASLLLLFGCKKESDKQITAPAPAIVENEESTDAIEVVEGGLKLEALTQLVKDLDGNKHSLGAIIKRYKGKPILIDVWASWCPDCIKGFPTLMKTQAEFDRVVYLFLSYDKTEQDWKIAIDKYGLVGEHFLIESDWKKGDFRKSVDLDWIPRYIVIDKTGKIALYRAIEADDPELIKTLKEVRE